MSLFHDPAHWRTSEKRCGDWTREVVAKSYDELADRAEARAKDA